VPELPDIVVYLDSLRPRIIDRNLERVYIRSPFLLRTVTPPVTSAEGRAVRSLRRLGKRIVIGLDDELFLVLHLMIAGRLHWKTSTGVGTRPGGNRAGIAAFHFTSGTLTLTEAGRKHRASLHVVQGEAGIRRFDLGGIEVLDVGLDDFRVALLRENHTLKRALTDPRLVSGIGNAYSDEILHRARLSPLTLTRRLNKEQIARLYVAARATLAEWTERLRRECGEGFPERVTAFRDGMAVHGRYRLPCPECGTPVQRIRYADNETNYCARCQTGGRLLADRAVSRLLKADWPRTVDEAEW